MIFNSFCSYSQTNEKIEHLLDEILLIDGNYNNIIESKQANELISYGEKILPKLTFFFTSLEISKLSYKCYNYNFTKGEISIMIAERIEPIPNFKIKYPVENYLWAGCKGFPKWVNYNIQKIRVGGLEQFKLIYTKWLNSSKRKRINRKNKRKLKKMKKHL
ncbi:hypothetical protein OD91_1095 [Lutibacter sp. Hel_I_33_5]|nr:hypothetical protein OD91_1095 [Lutibacter sp. Hel_I_33_5]